MSSRQMPLTLLSLRLFATLLLTTAAYAAEQPPVKVYILSGQSNMVGIGEVGPGGMSRFNTYVSAEEDAEQGSTLSIYAGEYDPDVNYDQRKPIETHQVRLGYWPHQSFPTLDKPCTSIIRGYIRIRRPGRYSFRTSGDSFLEIDGEEVHRRNPGEEQVTKIVKLNEGTYPIKATYFGRSRSYLAHSFFDLPGSLFAVVKEQGKYPFLLDDDGEWASRDDVWYRGVVTAGANKWLSVGCGAGDNKIGPELGFGWELGDYHEKPVLILKTSQGNRSLGWDFLPPGSERFEHDGYVYAGYKESPSRWEKGTDPEPIGWYAGKQYDDCVGAAKEVLADFDERFPHWKGRGYEIAGFAWWQGHKDTGNDAHAQRYEQNLVNLIAALRKDFDAPHAPFVIATIGFGGFEMGGNTLAVAQAQLAMNDYEKRPEFRGNVKTVDIRKFWPRADESPKNQGYHYHQNAETYWNVGQAMGQGMVELLEGK